MANSLTAFSPEIWSREMQKVFHKENVAIALTNTTYRTGLSEGDTLNKPYRSNMVVQTYTKGSDITAQDVSGTNEQLSVATAQVVPFYVDDIDKIQNKWDVALAFAADAQRMLNNALDQAVLAEYSNAANYIDAGDVGGSAGTSITLSTSNVQQVFTALARHLDDEDVPAQNRFVVVGSRDLEILRLYISGKDTSMADIVGNNGRVMERFGFEIFYSNNCPFTATWTPANQPSDNDTVTIAGVTITYKTTIGTTAGNCLSETSVAISLDNICSLINNDTNATEDTDWVDFSSANRWKLTKHGIVATDGTTAMTIVGYGDVVVAASETNDPWSVQVHYILAGVKGATDLVCEVAPRVEFRLAEKRLGKFVYPWMLYGKKTFADGCKELVYAKIIASSWA